MADIDRLVKSLKRNQLQACFAVQEDDNLGLTIRGGVEYGLGIYVTGVDLESVAYKNGLKVSWKLFRFIEKNCWQ